MRHQRLLLSALLLLGLGLTGLQAQENALAFNGTNQYVEAPNANIPSSGDFTVSVWAKHNHLQSSNPWGSWYDIVSQGIGSDAFFIGKEGSAQKIRVSSNWITSVDFPVDDAWHNYTVVKTDGNTWLYLDGTLADTKESVIPNPVNTSFNIARSNISGYYNNFFEGSIDEIQIWNRALSACDIEVNYEKDLTGNENGLVAYYNFNETTGTTLTDIVGTNDGTLYSAPVWEASGASITGTRPDVIVSTESISDITVSSATVNATIDFGTATTRGIVYGTSTCPDISGSKTEESGSFGTGSFSGSLSSLISGTTYYVRAYAIDPSGTSYGAEESFTTVGTPPTISSFDPISGEVGETVTITGTNFNTTPANNAVFFGATQATVSASTATSLTVTVPTGATYAPITVLNTETTLAAYSLTNFNPTFSPNAGQITTAAIADKEDFTTGISPVSVAIGDMDGDGKPDLAVTNRNSNTVSVLRNTGSIGTLSFATKVDFTTGNYPYSVSIGDLDGDGKLDLAVANYSSNTVSVLRNTGSSGILSFATKVDFTTESAPWSVVIGDIDGDGKPDLAVANSGSLSVSVLRNTGSSGTLSFATKEDFTTGTSPQSVAIGDINGDGKPDLAVANFYSKTVSVLRNTSSSGTVSFATKVDFLTGEHPRSVAIGDIDVDDKPDLVVTNFSSYNVSVFRNTGSSGTVSFAEKADFTTGTSPVSVAIGDMDGDGKPDLAVVNTNSNTASVLRNTGISGTLSFDSKVDFTTGSGPQSVTIGDMDGDGKPELAVTNYSSNSVSVLLNTPDFPPPTVTTQAVSDISTTTATGNGNITDLGVPDPTAHGVCWNTTGTPTTEDDFVDNGAASATGAFTSNITGLSAGTEYFVRAYATNSAGTSYGSEVSFTTKQSQTITFNALTDNTYGDADYSPGATAGSGLTVSYSSSNTNVAIIVSGKIHIVGIGSCTIYADQAGDASYDAAPQVSQDLTVNMATLSVNAENKSKEYDGTVFSPFTVTYSGFVNGEDESVLSGTLTFSGTATTATDVNTAYVITPAGLTSTNYDITFENGSLDITGKELTVTNAVAADKVYDGNTVAAITGSTLSGVVSGDDVALGDAANGTFEQATTGTDISVSTSMTLSGGDAGNYTLTQPTLTADITAKELTVTNAVAADKVYDGNTVAAITGSTLSGVVSGDDVTLGDAASGTFAKATTGTGISVSTLMTLSGGDAGNYTLTQPTLTADITEKALTITAENKSKVYDGIVYSPFTVIYSGFVNGEDEADLSGTLTFSGTASNATDVGTAYVITPAGLTSANYDITFENGSLDITQAAQTISFDPLEAKVEGDATFELTASSTSGLSISFTSSDPDVATISGSTVTIVGPGSTKITASQAGNDNYSAALAVEQMLTVHIYIAGDIDRNGLIDGTEIAGDADGNGSIEEPEKAGDTDGSGSIDGDEIAGDTNGSGSIDGTEISGDADGSGSIDGTEISGDTNGSGSIDGTEIAGDTDGSGSIDGTEISGDTDGSGSIDGTEISGDTDGSGSIDGTEISGDTNGSGSIDEAEITGDINGNGSIDGDEIAGDADGNGSIDGDEIADDIAEVGVGNFEVAMYPNPARGIVNLDITTKIAQNVKLTVIDITGRLLLQKQFSSAERITFDMSGEVSGIYFVKLDFEGKKVLKKLVVE